MSPDIKSGDHVGFHSQLLQITILKLVINNYKAINLLIKIIVSGAFVIQILVSQ